MGSASKMRILICGGEHPANFQHVRSIIESLDSDDEYVLCIGKEIPNQRNIENKPGIVGIIGRVFSRLGLLKNSFDPQDHSWEWRSNEGKDSWMEYCSAVKSKLPWIPEVVLVVTPNQGYTKSHIIPWSRKNGIPIVSVDHGMPTVRWPWLDYRGSMMGCDANAVWSEVCREINVQIGAERELQIITGSPSLDKIAEDDTDIRAELGIPRDTRILLLLGTHRNSVKTLADRIFQEVIETYSENSDYCIVYKPHPVEISKKEELKVPKSVVITQNQDLYISLIRSADAIVSPATSVVAAACAFYRPFVNVLSQGCGAAPDEEISKLEERLGGAVFPISRLHDVIQGSVEVDRLACDDAFVRFGYKRDGRNGQRVASLLRWVSEGDDPRDWVDTI